MAETLTAPSLLPPFPTPTDEGCRSFSYNMQKKVCVWSIEAIQYRIGWEFFAKVKKLDAFGKRQHEGEWRSFPDIMYQEPGYQKFESVSTKKCQEHCVKGALSKPFALLSTLDQWAAAWLAVFCKERM